MCDTLQANVGDLRRLVQALDDERDPREAALANGQDEPELESADREALAEAPLDAAPLTEHNRHEGNAHESNGHEANGAPSEARPAALAWTAPEAASTPPAAASADTPDEAMIDLAAIEAAEAAEAPAPEHAPEPEPAPVEALVAVGARSLEHEVDVPAAPLASAAPEASSPPVVSAPASSASTPVIAHMSAELFGAPEGAVEPLPDRGERRQRKGWARMSRKVKRAR